MSCCICKDQIDGVAINITTESDEDTYCKNCGEEMIWIYTQRNMDFSVKFEEVETYSTDDGLDVDHLYECYRDEINGY